MFNLYVWTDNSWNEIEKTNQHMGYAHWKTSTFIIYHLLPEWNVVWEPNKWKVIRNNQTWSRLKDDTTLHERTNLSVEQIMSLLEYTLTTTYFHYDNVCYQQIEGAAMGSPVSPIVTSLFVEDFEQKALSSFHTYLRFWRRYVDDTMVIIDKNLINEFTDHINNQHPVIKFTMEKECDLSLPMWDVLVTRDNIGKLRFKVYRKPTHTDHYLNFTSNHPLQH